MANARLQIRLEAVAEPASPVQRGGIAVKVSPTGFTGAAIWIEPNVRKAFAPGQDCQRGANCPESCSPCWAPAPAPARKASPWCSMRSMQDSEGKPHSRSARPFRTLPPSIRVLAVTHLAQVAARAHGHGFLSKETVAGRTRSQLAWLEDPRPAPGACTPSQATPEGKEALEHARSLLSPDR